MRGQLVFLAAASAGGMFLTPADAPSAGPAADFARDVQPLFRQHCTRCHGEKKQTAGFRLDRKAAAFKGGESGKPGIVAGNSGGSDVFRRVTTTDPDERMPPEGKRLTASEVALLREWIDAGAAWPDQLAGAAGKPPHWAFQTPRRPAPPRVNRPEWVKTPVDAFVLARLDRENLVPSPEADRVTLIRRLSLDLIGLPPSIAEVDAFLKDTAPGAYDRLVERLLSSPHYGERWARVWLDAARYADSDGFEKDKSRKVWFYRDWVVNALNRDLPYNQFVIEQLAGDLLPGATQDQIVATGYLRNSMINEEGGIDPEQFRMEAMFDRMDAIGKGVLGLTIQCAQCHDHKFDPLTQADYYRLFAFLNNDHESTAAVYTPEEQQKRADILRAVAAIEDELKHRTPAWHEQMAAWEAKVKGGEPDWVVLRPAVEPHTDGGQKYIPMADGSLLAQGYAPTKHTVRLTAATNLKKISAVRLELLNDPNLPMGGPGRSVKGTGALTEFRVEVAPAANPAKRTPVKIAKATADVNPAESELDPMFDDKSNRRRVTGPVSFAIDGKEETAWGFDVGPGRRNVPRKAVFSFEKPVDNPGEVLLTISLGQNHGGWNSDDNQNHNLGRFRLSVTSQPGAVADQLPATVRGIIDRPADRRTPAEAAAVFSYWRTTVPAWAEANHRIERLWEEHPEGTTQLTLTRREQPRVTHMLKRGDFLKPGRAVAAGVPSFLHPLPATPENALPGRLAFARWLVDPTSPTTARSFVNRAWQAYFGTGLVPSAEDLGTQSEPPSHPELLDWLAVEFVDRGWSQKDLHRVIVRSATYRQSSTITPEWLARDPYNRLLARGPRFRVDAEAVRDVFLASSGLLDPTLGGRSVFPPLPGWMFKPPVSYGPKQWPTDTDSNRYRRALYTFRYRSIPHPFFQTFDAPNGDFACVRRARSNTPLQSLMTLNEPLSMDAARSLALLAVTEGGNTDPDRLEYTFRRCVARKPSPAEVAALLALLAKQRRRFDAPDATSSDLALSNPSVPPPLPAGVTLAQLASWTAVSRVVLNLDETITKE